jgi:hypothetical protein
MAMDLNALHVGCSGERSDGVLTGDKQGWPSGWNLSRQYCASHSFATTILAWYIVLMVLECILDHPSCGPGSLLGYGKCCWSDKTVCFAITCQASVIKIWAAALQGICLCLHQLCISHWQHFRSTNLPSQRRATISPRENRNSCCPVRGNCGRCHYTTVLRKAKLT